VSAWDGPSRRAAHGWSGLGVRSERYMCGCVRCAAENRRTATARSGIFGWTIRDPSCFHWMAVGIRQVCGRLSAAKPFVCSAAKCVPLRRRGCDAFGRFAHSAWASRVWPVAIRWLGSDLRSGQRHGWINPSTGVTLAGGYVHPPRLCGWINPSIRSRSLVGVDKFIRRVLY
jgi:hypothetical protein